MDLVFPAPNKRTRFRAFQLGTKGSSFSYFDGFTFTLIEARVTELSAQQLIAEMKVCGVSTIYCLHITSWDDDHCDADSLSEILTYLRPARVECPGYAPHTDTGIECNQLIAEYQRRARGAVIQHITPGFMRSLAGATSFTNANVFYHPTAVSTQSSNDNSTVKLFRSGAFTVGSFGDIESPTISKILQSDPILQSELDVMILAHHGADNGFTTNALLDALQPSVAVCSSNYDNQFEHPRQSIRDLLHQRQIPLYTTKTGDIIIESLHPHDGSRYRVANLIANSSRLSSVRPVLTKRAMLQNSLCQALGIPGRFSS